MEKKSAPAHKIRLKILGVGGAGCNTVGRIADARCTAHHPLQGVELFAVNTDLQALTAINAAQPIQIGAALTHGLGAGGDVEIGARAAQHDAEKLEAIVQNTDVVFLTAGMGGGTGTGASPVVARLAREQGALVLAFVAMPFAFEGERRRQQALAGLDQLKAQADAVICIPNDKIFKMAGENASVLEVFHRADEIFVTGARALWQLLSRKGLINLDFAALRATLGAKHCDGLFSHGRGEGPNKARDAVKALLENPVLDGADVLAKAEGLLVSILGGPDLTVADVQRAVEPLTRSAGRAHVILGAAIDEDCRDKIEVTVIAAANILPRRALQHPPARTASVFRHGRATSVDAAATPVAPAGAPPGPEPAAAATGAAASPGKKPAKLRQETLALDGIPRGRFDKSEPTLYDGEDLDVPTYLRRGVSLKR